MMDRAARDALMADLEAATRPLLYDVIEEDGVTVVGARPVNDTTFKEVVEHIRPVIGYHVPVGQAFSLTVNLGLMGGMIFVITITPDASWVNGERID